MKAKFAGVPFFWMFFLLTAFFSVAFAQAPGAVDGNVTDQQAIGLIGKIWENVAKGQYWPLIGPIVVLLVWLVKKFDQDIPKIGPALSKFMDQPVVSFALPFVFAAAGGLGNAIAVGQSPKEAVGTIFKIAMEAIVIYVGGKKIAEQKEAAGAAEAAKVTDKASAIEELKKS